jgi:hypothetical protein
MKQHPLDAKLVEIEKMLRGLNRRKTMTNRYLTIVFATLIFALAFVAMMTSIRSADAHRMTGRDIRRSGVHHCTWSAASACKRPSQRRQVPCGNGRYCRW